MDIRIPSASPFLRDVNPFRADTPRNSTLDKVIKATMVLFAAFAVSGGVLLLGAGTIIACSVGVAAMTVVALASVIHHKMTPIRVPSRENPDALIGVEPASTLRGQQIRLDDELGTRGVNRAGSSELDRAIAHARVRDVMEKVGPHAHTYRSRDLFQRLMMRLASNSLNVTEENTSVAGMLALHQQNKQRMIDKFGRQLTVGMIGAGPIGLAAVIAFYKLGFKVTCFETRPQEGPAGFTSRSQPFSLMRQSFWYLNSLGITNTALLAAFGADLTEDERRREEVEKIPVSNSGFSKMLTPVMGNVKKTILGEDAAGYLPGYLSLPINKIQQLLMGMISQIRAHDKDDLSLNFNSHCTASFEGDGRRIIEVNGVRMTPDILYNASGGRVNDTLQVPFSTPLATYYGMGAFFPRPAVKSQSHAPVLTRSVRVFCSNIRDEEVYCGIELTREEYENPLLQQRVLRQVESDVGLPKASRSFPVPIELKHVQSAALQSSSLSATPPQVTICGGDAFLQPHFLTGSGANFGLLELILLDSLLSQWINQPEFSQDLLVQKYNEAASLFQKQSCQTVVNMMGRPLI